MADSNSSVALNPVCLDPLSLGATVLVGDVTMLVVVVGTVAGEVTVGTVVSTVASAVGGKVTVGTVVSTVASVVADRIASETVPVAVTGMIVDAKLAVVGSIVGGCNNSSSKDRLQRSVLTLMSTGMASLINLNACVPLAFI